MTQFRNTLVVTSSLLAFVNCADAGEGAASTVTAGTSAAGASASPAVNTAGQSNVAGQGSTGGQASPGGVPANVGGSTPSAGSGGTASTGGSFPNPSGGATAAAGGSAGGAPATNGGAPATNGGAPAANGGSPAANGGSPAANGGSPAANGGSPATGPDVLDTGADPKFSFFVTSYHHIKELAGTDKGFGGDLRYNGAATGLEGADALCQEMARRVGFGNKTWKAYLSTSKENAIDRIGSGPWYDHAGKLVAQNKGGLTASDRPAGGCCDTGTYDELGTFHDGKTDQNNDNKDDDDHDTLTATNADGTYAGFSCDDWTSVSATPPAGGGRRGGAMMGHSWPARSGQNWSQAHSTRSCAAGVNFIQNGGGDGTSVGSGGGYGGFYCFALPAP